MSSLAELGDESSLFGDDPGGEADAVPGGPRGPLALAPQAPLQGRVRGCSDGGAGMVA